MVESNRLTLSSITFSRNREAQIASWKLGVIVSREQHPFPAMEMTENEGFCLVLMETSVAFVELKRTSLSTDI